MKQFVKRVLTSLAPETMASIQSARSRAHSHRLIREWGIADLNQKLVAKFGYTVQSGPFQGMLLSAMCSAEHIGPYLLGTYEYELHNWYERFKRGHYNQILDVGAKFGYYAVGIARSHLHTPVIAFDPDWWAREAVLEVNNANRISNVSFEPF